MADRYRSLLRSFRFRKCLEITTAEEVFEYDSIVKVIFSHFDSHSRWVNSTSSFKGQLVQYKYLEKLQEVNFSYRQFRFIITVS